MYNYYQEKMTKGSAALFLIQFVLYGIVYVIAYHFNETQNNISALLLVALAVETYLFFGIKTKDIIDICGVFFGTWTFPIGLCMLRLSEIQEPWQVSTWFEFALTPVVFFLAFYAIQQLIPKHLTLRNHLQVGQISCEYHANLKREYILVLCFVALASILMVVQFCIKGYFPLFSSEASARLDFYTRLIVLIAASEGVLPICYRLITEEKGFTAKKKILWIALVIPFIIALLRLSRGEYIVTMVCLIPSVYYFSKRRVLALALCVVLFISGYYGSTLARKETKTEADEYFQMEQPVHTSEPSTETEIPQTPEQNESASGKVVNFTYFYLINGFENYNHATMVCNQYSYGLRQFTPFNVVLRSPSIKEAIDQLPDYTLVKGSTKCLIAYFFLDFGHWFVYVGMMLWGLAAGVIHLFAKKLHGAISMNVYGVCFLVCTLGFFTPWLSYFEVWMFWGVSLIFALANCKFSIQKKKTAE